MATALRLADSELEPNMTTKCVDAFLADLNEITLRHGLGLSDGASVFIMEKNDYSRSYALSDQSELTFI